jgi:hypothetical protein
MKKLAALLAIITISPAVTRAQPYTYQPPYSYDGEGDAAIARYQYNRAIREQETEEKKQWDDYAKKHALPIARPNEPPSNDSAVAEPGNSGPTDVPPQGFRIVHPPETTSSIASDKTRDPAEPPSFSDLPTKPRDRLW